MIEHQEKALVLLFQWLGRVAQYSAAHPTARAIGTETHAAFLEALQAGPLDAVVQKEGILLGEAPAKNPVLRTRAAPYLHDRGVLAVRFDPGLREDELTAFVELLALPVQDIFARGGLRRVLPERRVVHVRVEEISHELSAEERAAEQQKKRLRDVFGDAVSRIANRRGFGAGAGSALLELLENAPSTARMLEEQENVAEAVAGIVLLAIQHEKKTGTPLMAKTRALLLELSPDVRAKVFLGFPELAGDFRAAMETIYPTFPDRDLARFGFPCVRLRPEDLERFFYVASAITTTRTGRLALLRRVAAMLHDLPLEQPASLGLLSELSSPPPEGTRYAEGRALLSDEAERVTSASMLFDDRPSTSQPRAESFAPGALDRLTEREVSEVITLSASMPDFRDLCARLPRSAEYLAGGAGAVAVSELFRALQEVNTKEADEAVRGIARSDAALELLKDVEARAQGDALEGSHLEETVSVLRVIARERPEPLLDMLTRVESRKVRRILLDLLPEAGPMLLPLVRTRLASKEWFVVRNMVTLVRRAGGGSVDLRAPAAHAQPQVRIEVVRAIRGLADETAQAILVALLADPVPEIRGGALALLGEIDLGPTALKAIADLAGDSRRDDEARMRAVAALGRSKSDDAARSLAHLIEPRGVFETAAATALRERAAAALHQSRAPLAATLFEAALHSSNRRVRKTCEKVTGAKGDE
jgi:hypothetical protein